MESLGQLLLRNTSSLPVSEVKAEKTLAKTEQDDIINHFLIAINKERKTPVKFMAVKMKLYAIRNDKDALREFYAQCLDYKRRKGSFGKCFFGALKTK